MIKVMHVVGARPNFMKIAPIVREMAAHQNTFQQILVHTGQHYDRSMSDVFFEDLAIPEPDVNLEVGSGSQAWQVAQIMLRFEPILLEHRPDWVIVVGDVNSTIACALVAAKLNVRVAHVEAGLRSFDTSMPEEINRILTDRISSLLLTPSEDANENLRREGVNESNIVFVGNVMIDSLVQVLPKATMRQAELLAQINAGTRYILATLHRPSNVDDPERLKEIVQALNRIAGDIPVIFPVHPRTRQRLADMQIDIANSIYLIDPKSYIDFLALQTGAALVLTDSGGIQEETSFLGIPCLTLRPNTERPITITHGTNRLVPPGEDISSAVFDSLETKIIKKPSPMQLWDGRTAQRIAQALISTSLTT